MSDARLPPNGHDDAARETPHGAPREGLGANATTREGAAQPRNTHREAPMPERPLGTTAARAGATTGTVRYVLIISVALAILGMILAFTLM
jgi:hypothetical protein